ncbi:MULTISPECIES: hypothetical protein [Mycobacteroides]|uniref:Lipoprotein n=1 Tax=Mycobacteroides chelonae TaxID=1774 RepID=A0A1S1LMD0_MYCCH|nr:MULTISPECIES: hypothetical protein [Mycobacteroides]KRQ23125.1 hypothetical protein AOT87_13865 [Mycobacteroides sp. H003]KRQ33937.1 hypothetical protein AOT91_08340 [Mycobacteroides sp. H092]KRQ39861.1 hypothetical protein AOT92_17085 [Mycobacteroides sp. H101]KRQ46546.1 hypothetical protein AOT88_18415 [Mycobacteroides sp. H063]KRQ63583.1 hypothetical protein AOT94_01635 [Mycobacteroides sp. HXVII]
MRKLQCLLLITTMLVSGCAGWIREGKEVTGPTVNDQGFSLLTEAGIAEIERSKHARFDLRNRELTRQAVGLAGSKSEPMIGTPGGAELTFTFLGPSAEENVVTQNITFASTDLADTLDLIVWFSAPATIEDAHAELRSGIYRWGFRPEDVQRWITNSTKRDDDKEFLGMGVGLAGLIVGVTARRKNGNDVYEYQLYLDPALYTANAIDAIKKTGKHI